MFEYLEVVCDRNRTIIVVRGDDDFENLKFGKTFLFPAAANLLGEARWEMVQVVFLDHEGRYIYYFKRQVSRLGPL